MSTDADEWLLRREAAKYLGISFSTLAHMASRRVGPQFYLYANRARYRKSDLDDWIRSTAVHLLPPQLQRFSVSRGSREMLPGLGKEHA